jgi:hypothetical protein
MSAINYHITMQIRVFLKKSILRNTKHSNTALYKQYLFYSLKKSIQFYVTRTTEHQNKHVHI